LRHQRIDLGLVADVAVHVQAAQFLASAWPRASSMSAITTLRAFAREAARAGFAYALRAAGDDADAAGQAERNGGSCGGGGVHARMVPAQASMKFFAFSAATWAAVVPGLYSAEPMPKPLAPAAM
jgi:hypothetical protein